MKSLGALPKADICASVLAEFYLLEWNCFEYIFFIIKVLFVDLPSDEHSYC